MTYRPTHIRLCVPDVQACYRFYRDVLQLVPRFDAEGSAYAEFDAGGFTLALFDQSLMARAVNSPVERVATDISVVVGLAVEDVDQATASLRKHGVVMVTEPHDQPDWTLRVAHFRDPAGNLLEINAPLAR